MQDLSIRDVPDKLAEGLRLRARRHRRSLQGELMVIVELAVAETDGLGRPFDPAPMRERRGSFRRGWKTMGQLHAEILSQQTYPLQRERNCQ